MKKPIVIISIIIAAASLIFLAIFLLNKYGSFGEHVSDTSASLTKEEVNTTSSETIAAIEKDLYFSDTNDFTDYFFKIPKGWSFYEKDNGERLVLKNNDSDMKESIIINIESLDGVGDLIEDAVFEERYFAGLSDFDSASKLILDNNDIYIGDIDAEILGYKYINGFGEEKESIDLITRFIYDNGFYVIKYIGENIDEDDAFKVFKKFLDDFKIGPVNNLSSSKPLEQESVNLLILGDDSAFDRPGGRVNGRTDIMMIFHLNLENGEGTIVTIPRDTWVEIPGHGNGKINGAHAIGGNELTVETVEKLSGLKINNYIITDFDGFKPLIDFFGGVTVEINEDLADSFSGCYLSKGIHHLNGEQALALVRNRHRNGESGQQGGAYAREREAAKVIIALMRQQSDFEKFIKMPFFINYLLKYVWTDMEFDDVAKYLVAFGRINYSKIEITTIPSWPEMVGDASAVVYDAEATKELFETVKQQ
jgi:LCP family protein required for cell wall assembly